MSEAAAEPAETAATDAAVTDAVRSADLFLAAVWILTDAAEPASESEAVAGAAPAFADPSSAWVGVDAVVATGFAAGALPAPSLARSGPPQRGGG